MYINFMYKSLCAYERSTCNPNNFLLAKLHVHVCAFLARNLREFNVRGEDASADIRDAPVEEVSHGATSELAVSGDFSVFFFVDIIYND